MFLSPLNFPEETFSRISRKVAKTCPCENFFRESILPYNILVLKKCRAIDVERERDRQTETDRQTDKERQTETDRQRRHYMI